MKNTWKKTSISKTNTDNDNWNRQLCEVMKNLIADGTQGRPP